MKPFLNLLTICLLSFSLSAQPTDLRVYEIFQNKCVNCHNHANPQADLDLEGSGNNTAEKMLSVYNNLVGITPTNTTAASNKYQFIMPGRVDKSFLFKKINQGLDKDMELEAGEKDPMPVSGSLTDVEKELIRQWILYGAPKNKLVVKEELLKEYYENGNSRAAFPNGAPPPPDPSEGFQIKMGPLFLDPAGEDEFFTLYRLNNPEPIEVSRLNVIMPTFSHHFIIYDYSSDASQVPDGLRRDQDHTQDVSFVATVQETSDIILPKKTAFKWDKNHVLDLNSHTINFAADKVYQSEVYINVYTQPAGIAAQEMKATLIPYPFINIPNNGNVITHRAKTPQFPGEIFIWNMGAHTHQLGTGYKIWLNNSEGNADELVYDASCPRGMPDCVAPFYDYQHIPNRTFDDLLYVNLEYGLTHEATWINDGPKTVRWGATSEDEMMLFGLLFVTDTTGLGQNATTPIIELENPLAAIQVIPNPMQNYTNIVLPEGIGFLQFRLHDMLGKEVRQINKFNTNFLRIERGNLAAGMYLFTIKDESGRTFSGKILME